MAQHWRLGHECPVISISLLSVRPCGTLSATHKRDQTVARPALSRVRDPKPIPSPLVQRAGRDHPFPIFAESPWRERDLARSCHPGEKNTGIEPHPAHRSPRRRAKKLGREFIRSIVHGVVLMCVLCASHPVEVVSGTGGEVAREGYRRVGGRSLGFRGRGWD